MKKRYLYNYQTIVRFYGNVSNHFIKLRCVPCNNACQHVEQDDFIIHPNFPYQQDIDAFGNKIVYGGSLSPHDSMAYISSGIVQLSPYAIPAESAEPFYLCQTAKTAINPDIAPARAAANALDDAIALCGFVHNSLTYSPSATNVGTTAAEALALGKGVCQDYAHILIALCRTHAIPARYVNGFISGEGATHAWVEIFDGTQWRGLDPTHNRLIEYGYIKIAHGRDADDCPVSRGTFVGDSSQQTEIRVIVQEL